MHNSGVFLRPFADISQPIPRAILCVLLPQVVRMRELLRSCSSSRIIMLFVYTIAVLRLTKRLQTRQEFKVK
jgi:hypothetical protein